MDKDTRPRGRANKIPKHRRVAPGSTTLFPPEPVLQPGKTLRRGSGVLRPPGVKEEKPRETERRRVKLSELLQRALDESDARTLRAVKRIITSSKHKLFVSMLSEIGDRTEGRPPQKIQIQEVQPIVVVQPADPAAQEASSSA